MLFEIIGVTKGWYDHGYGWNVMKTTSTLVRWRGLNIANDIIATSANLIVYAGRSYVPLSVCRRRWAMKIPFCLGGEIVLWWYFLLENCINYHKSADIDKKCAWRWMILYTHIFLYYIVVVGWYQSTYCLFFVLSLSLQC